MKTTIDSEYVKGVVLKTTPFKENDIIAHVYTLEYGKISILARGVKKINSKNAPSVMSLTLSEWEIFLKKGISTLVKGQVIDYYKHIKEHIESEIIANYILEYFYRYIDENAPSLEEYEILTECLTALNNGYSYLLIYLVFNAYILKMNGIELSVDGCSVCGDIHITGFSLENGGFVCANHSRLDEKKDPALLKAIRHIYKINIKDIDKIDIEEHLLKQVIPIFDYYIDEYCGINLRAKTFIEQLL